MSVRSSMRSLSAQILAAVRTRVEMFGLEWQQARGQIAAIVGLLLAGVALLWLAAMMFSFMVVTLAWSTPYRNWVVLGLLLLYLLAGLACLTVLKRKLESPENHPFSVTIDELGKDASMLMQAIEGEPRAHQQASAPAPVQTARSEP